MENVEPGKEEKNEKRIGVIPASELEGSDADYAYSDEDTNARENAEQSSGADADAKK